MLLNPLEKLFLSGNQQNPRVQGANQLRYHVHAGAIGNYQNGWLTSKIHRSHEKYAATRESKRNK